MTSAIYTATVNSINSSLVTAGITTLTFTAIKAKTIDVTTYPNLIDYYGYILESDNLKVNSIIASELAKAGEFSAVKSPARVVTVPADPSGDHFLSLNGYYISNSDLPQDLVKFKKFSTDVETATKSLSSNVQNKAKAIGYSTVSENTTSVITTPTASNITPEGTKVVTSTVVITIFKAP